MFGFLKRDELSEVVESAVRRTLEDTQRETAQRFRTVSDLQGQIASLREELETLRIEKARKEEEFSRKEREIEHKVGLERKRQAFEVEQARREATVELREENLSADRDRFKSEMEFQRERLEEEVAALRDLTGKLLERLPSASIIANIGGHSNGYDSAAD